MQLRKKSEIETPLLQNHQPVYGQNSSDSKENKTRPLALRYNPAQFFNAGPRDQKMVFDDKSLLIPESQIIPIEPYELEYDRRKNELLNSLCFCIGFPIEAAFMTACMAVTCAMVCVGCNNCLSCYCCCAFTSNYAYAALLATEIGAGIGGGITCPPTSWVTSNKCYDFCAEYSELKAQSTDIRNFYRVGRDVLHIINSYIPEDNSPSPIITPT